MLKTKEGPVVWRASKCMGCRYCMVSCPFDIPKFEYHSPTAQDHEVPHVLGTVVAGQATGVCRVLSQ